MIYAFLIYKSLLQRKTLNSFKIFKLIYFKKIFISRPTKKYIYGSQNYIDINIHVENTKEDAFESQCLITLPQGVNYVKAFITQSSLVFIQVL